MHCCCDCSDRVVEVAEFISLFVSVSRPPLPHFLSQFSPSTDGLSAQKQGAQVHTWLSSVCLQEVGLALLQG